MKSITQLAIEKKRVTLLALILIIFSGISAYYQLPKAEDPGFIIRFAQIQTRFPGAGPERVDKLITDPLEEEIQEMPEIDFISSVSRPGVSIILVAIKSMYSDLDPIWDDLRKKVNQAKKNLPQGISGPDVNDEFGDVFGTVVAITGEGFNYSQLKSIAEDVRNELLLIEEVAKVDYHGIQEEKVFIEFNNARLADYGLSPSLLRGLLSARNIIISGGEIYTKDETLILEPTGNFESLEEIGKTLIQIPGKNDMVALKDIVTIKKGYQDPPGELIRYNGEPGIALSINLREGGNIIDLGRKTQELISRLKSIYPIGIEFNIPQFQPKNVDDKVNEFLENLIQSIVIVLLVMLVSLGARTGIVVASLIPITFAMSFMFMGIFNIGIDTVSLASLIISLGMLVDNAIVMSESIIVQMESGKNPVRAAIDSANELKLPLLTSSLTTSVAFLPIFLAESQVGEYTASLFKVVTITLLSSWFVSLTIIPMFCYMFLKVKKSDRPMDYSTPFYEKYERFLKHSLKRPIRALSLVFIIFIVVMNLFAFLPKLFFPEDEKPVITAQLEYPLDTPIEKTEEMIKSVEAYMKTNFLANQEGEEGIKDWITYIGNGGPRFTLGYNPSSSNSGFSMMVINTTSKEIRHPLIDSLETFVLNHFPDIRATIQTLNYGPPVDADIQIRLSGKNMTALFDYVEQIKERLRNTDGIKNIRDDWGQKRKKLIVSIDQARLRRAGLTSQDIALSLQSMFKGTVISEYRGGKDIIPIVLRSEESERKNLGQLENHSIFNQATGAAIPLKQVADINLVFEPGKLIRRDRLLNVTISTDVSAGYEAISISKNLKNWLDEESSKWGLGYRFEMGGADEASAEANQSIFDQLFLAFMIILLLLILEFNSFRKTLIVLVTIPLGVIGVVIGLFAFQSYFGFMTLLGIVSLAGIVINNAIVLLDRIKIEIEKGLPPQEAIIFAAKQRTRPILLTTATTIGGMVPLYLGGGAMWEPMAVAIMAGLFFSTILTLGVVPVLYAVFYKIRY